MTYRRSAMARIKRRYMGQDTLFSVDSARHLPQRLDELNWPEPQRFPVNRGGAHVRDVLVPDLIMSKSFLAVVGYSSVAELIDLVEFLGTCGAEREPCARCYSGRSPS